MGTNHRDEAKRLLAEGRTAEAIRCYEDHLELDDEDHEARLEYGLACLIAGHRDRFIEVGMEYQPCMSPHTLQRLGGRIRSLWSEYAGSCARFAAASAIGASVVVACGCNDKPAPQPEPAPATTQEFVNPPGAPETPPPPEAPPVVAETEPPPTKTEADAGVKPTKKPPQMKPPQTKKPPVKDYPKTRYVAVNFDDDKHMLEPLE